MAIPNRLPMIDSVVTISLIMVLLIIFFQDYRDRMVYWFLYPLVGILAFCIQYLKNGFVITLLNAICNLIFILLLLGCSYLYASRVLQKKFLETMGWGDILLFLALTFCFSPVPFIVLLVFSLIFALGLYMILKSKSLDNTVPLAGYISLFFTGAYMASFFTSPKLLYA